MKSEDDGRNTDGPPWSDLMKDRDGVMATSQSSNVAARRFLLLSLHSVVASLLIACVLLAVAIRDSDISDFLNVDIFSRAQADTPSQTSAEEDVVSNGVYLPSERLRERQFDQAQRLIAGGRMADATALLDEMLTAEQDVFLEAGSANDQTRRSMKALVTELIGTLPEAGTEAYQLQFRTRADRHLRTALDENDDDGIIAVARRWFHTEAGHRAAILTAARFLQSGQPLAAEAWLERIAASPMTNLPANLLPTFKLMQAATSIAIDPSKKTKAKQFLEGIDTPTRLGGEPIPKQNLLRDQLLMKSLGIAVSGRGSNTNLAAENWEMSRGTPDRNSVRPCDRPLLVPRFRVPLTLHPQEKQLLAKRRELLIEQGSPVLPSGTPLAIGNSLLVQSRAGVMAIDFESGKRVWIEGKLAASAIADRAQQELEEQGTHPLDPLFYDTTSSTLSSDGELVFVVEGNSSPTSRQRLRQTGNSRNNQNSNRLVAYDIEQNGQLRWQLPRANNELAGEEPNSRWFLGSPLPLGNELFVLVEERQQIRLDVLSSATGETIWSQPLAEVDVEYDINNRNDRKQLGLSPTFADGILVCPTGAGAAIAVDLTARTLLWAYRFTIPKPDDVRRLANGIQLRMQVLAGNMAGMQIKSSASGNTDGGKWLDALPIVAGDRALLTPAGSEFLHCVNIRTGELLWRSPRADFITVAGITNRMVILLGQKTAAAVSIDDGKIAWKQTIGPNDELVCGRGILSGKRLYVPIDTPAVAEIDTSNGKVVGLSLGRGSSLPGNLVSYRGEVISQGLDSLDVYHQTADLERGIETALKENPNDPWAVSWRGELELDEGDTSEGLLDIRRIHGSKGPRPSASTVSRAIQFALKNDFLAAADFWTEGVEIAPSQQMAATIRQLAAEGYLQAHEPMKAWEVCRNWLRSSTSSPPSDDETLIQDPIDTSLWIASSRWFQRKLNQILETQSPEPIRQIIDEDEKNEFRKVTSITDPSARHIALDVFRNRFANRNLKDEATSSLRATLQEELSGLTGIARQNILLQLKLLAPNTIGRKNFSQNASKQMDVEKSFVRDAWPLGQVDVTQSQEATEVGDVLNKPTQVRLIHAPNSDFPGATLEHTGRSIVLRDQFGAPIGDAISIDLEGAKHPHLTNYFRLRSHSAFLISRILLLQTSHSLTAFEICKPTDGEHRLLWATTDDRILHPRQNLTTQTPSTSLERLLRPLGPLPLLSKVAVELSTHQIQRIPTFRIGHPQRTGVPIISGNTLELRDIRTGKVLWRRRNIPVGSELFGDSDVLCITGRDGKNSQILSMTDGHLISCHDLPPRQDRLGASGKHLLVVNPADPDTTRKIQLAVIDVRDNSQRIVCECLPSARGLIVDDDIFLVITPDGHLTAIDIPARQTKFSTTLQDMPEGFRQLRCLSWQDNYILFAIRKENRQDEKRFNGIDAIDRFGTGSGHLKAESSTIWSISQLTGDMIWSQPASVQRHIIQTPQPTGLPTLIFGRRLRMANTSTGQGGNYRGRYRLSLLCLDKRTGSLLHLDDKLRMEPDQNTSTAELSIRGDAVNGTVEMKISSRRQMGGNIPKIILHFTGEHTENTQPFRAEEEPLVYTDILSEVKHWIERAILAQ